MVSFLYNVFCKFIFVFIIFFVDFILGFNVVLIFFNFWKLNIGIFIEIKFFIFVIFFVKFKFFNFLFKIYCIVIFVIGIFVILFKNGIVFEVFGFILSI